MQSTPRLCRGGACPARPLRLASISQSPTSSAGILPAFLRSHATTRSSNPAPYGLRRFSAAFTVAPSFTLDLSHIRAIRTTATIIAPQLTNSIGNRNTLRPVHFRADASVIAPGSALSNAIAFGMKSTNDQTLATAWLINATHNHPRTAGAGHAATRAEITESSNAV